MLSVDQAKINTDGVLSTFKSLAYSQNGENALLNVNEEMLVWYDLHGNIFVRGLPILFSFAFCI